jgi:hypothetical protein
MLQREVRASFALIGADEPVVINHSNHDSQDLGEFKPTGVYGRQAGE